MIAFISPVVILTVSSGIAALVGVGGDPLRHEST